MSQGTRPDQKSPDGDLTRQILALRDSVKSKMTRLMLDDNSLLRPPYDQAYMPDKIAVEKWVDFRLALFQAVLNDVGAHPVNEFKDLEWYPKLERIIKTDHECKRMKAQIKKLLIKHKYIFFACNYWCPLSDPPDRNPAVLAVDEDSKEIVKSAYYYHFMNDLRKSFLKWDKGYYPINDLIAKEATTKRVWAICFAEGVENFAYAQRDFSLDSAASTEHKKELPPDQNHEGVTLIVPLEPFVNRPSENWTKKKVIRTWSEQNQNVLSGTLEYLKWNFFRDDYMQGKEILLKHRPVVGECSNGEGLLTEKDAYVVLTSLQPFVRKLGMRCHYAFPAYFAVPQEWSEHSRRNIKRETFCSTLSVATKEPLTMIERKVLSDLATRLLLTPLVEDFGIRARTAESKKKHLTGYIGNSEIVNNIWREPKDYWAHAVCAFADVSGFTASFHNLQKDKNLKIEVASREVVTFFRRLWTNVTSVIQNHQGAIGAYIGDGIFFYFTNAEPFTEEYGPIDEEILAVKAIACALKLRQIFEDEMKKAGTSVKKHFKRAGFHIGMNSGSCLLGNLAGDNAFHFSVMSSTVNLAARLMSLAEKDEIVVHRDILTAVDTHLTKHLKRDFNKLVSKHDLKLGDLVKGEKQRKKYKPFLTEEVSRLVLPKLRRGNSPNSLTVFTDRLLATVEGKKRSR